MKVRGPIARIGVASTDKRRIEKLIIDALNYPLLWLTFPLEQQTEVIGRITRVEFLPNGWVWAQGSCDDFDRRRGCGIDMDRTWFRPPSYDGVMPVGGRLAGVTIYASEDVAVPAFPGCYMERAT